LSVALVTDATAPARYVSIQVDDGANILLVFPASTTQAASLTRTYQMAEYCYQPAASGSLLFFSLPLDLRLFQGWRIRTSTASLAAGDDWAAPRMMVEEWIGG
jgi:hypothetical protein